MTSSRICQPALRFKKHPSHPIVGLAAGAGEGGNKAAFHWAGAAGLGVVNDLHRHHGAVGHLGGAASGGVVVGPQVFPAVAPFFGLGAGGGDARGRGLGAGLARQADADQALAVGEDDAAV
jgi:hypothetical protein